MPDDATKTCPICGETRPLGEFHRRASSADGHARECRECRLKTARRYYQANRESALAYQRRYYQDNGPAVRAYQRRYREGNRVVVFAHYGDRCVCCGTSENLTVDHVNGDGAQHRKELYGDPQRGTTRFYRWLIRQGFPPGFQTLCLSCNISKKDGPRCRLDHTKEPDGTVDQGGDPRR